LGQPELLARQALGNSLVVTCSFPSVRGQKKDANGFGIKEYAAIRIPIWRWASARIFQTQNNRQACRTTRRLRTARHTIR
jgi:hypothetical protein